jgi:SAM-dependent methyltransferase
MSSDSVWWSNRFDEYVELGLRAATAQATPSEAAIGAFLVRELGLVAGDRVFDQCCGIGRLSIPLAQAGIAVTGVDINPAYIDQARSRALAASVGPDLYVGDPAEFIAPEPCKGAFNWFSGVGQSSDDEQNRRIAERARDSLVPGGLYAVDFNNMPRVLTFRQNTVLTRHRSPDGAELLVLQELDFDFAAGVLRSAWTLVHPDGHRRHHHSEHRMYMPYDIVRLLEAAGFSHVCLIGSIGGEPFEQWAVRCIAIATR